MERLQSDFPCRSKEIRALFELFGPEQSVPYPAFYVYGHASTGKSSIVAALLRAFRFPHSFINCVECYTPRLLFETLLNRLCAFEPNFSTGYESYACCNNVNDFARYLKKAIEDMEHTDETVYLVLDKAERLCDMDFNILPFFLRLQELIEMNVCVILISEIIWEKFAVGMKYFDPIKIHFPQYSKEELVDILALKSPAEYSQELYRNYLEFFLKTLYPLCRNLSELDCVTAANFKTYVEPIERGEMNETNHLKLWKNFAPHLRKALTMVFQREDSAVQTQDQDIATTSAKQAPKLDATFPAVAVKRRNVELPFYAKFLIIAAYLASYNPSRTDQRFFLKNRTKVQRMRKTTTKVDGHLLGPKIFPLDRLLAIFYSIVEDRVPSTASIFNQITSLVSLKLLSQISTKDTLDTPKYKCLVTLEEIVAISKSVRFDVTKYLYDFV